MYIHGADELLHAFTAHSRYLQDHQVDDTGSELNYGAGKSRFYAASDRGSHASVSKLLPTNPNNKDHTLYLSRYAHRKMPDPLGNCCSRFDKLTFVSQIYVLQ